MLYWHSVGQPVRFKILASQEKGAKKAKNEMATSTKVYY